MSKSGNEQCDCAMYRAFKHRRKKCTFGIGKSSSPRKPPPVLYAQPVDAARHDVAPIYPARECAPISGSFSDGQNAENARCVSAPHRGPSSGGCAIVSGADCSPVGVAMAVPLPYDLPPQHVQHGQLAPADTAPSFGSRLSTAFGNGVVNGTQLGATMGTATIVRDAIVVGTYAVVGGVVTSLASGKKKKA